jgi:hypothetical protein
MCEKQNIATKNCHSEKTHYVTKDRHHAMKCDYRRVLDRLLDLLHTSIQRVTTLYNSPLHTHTVFTAAAW